MITRAIDPVTDKEIVMISGPVERIIIKEAERTAKNLEYGITHTASLLIGGTYINYISLGIKEGREPNIAINQGTKDSPKWVQIQETDEVKVIVTEKVVGDKTYYSAKRTGIKLLKKNATPGQQSQQSNGQSGGQSSYTAKPKGSTEGVQTGHAFNGAMNFILTQGVDPTNENIVKYAQHVHNVTEKVKAAATEKHKDMDTYSVGAMVGNSILNACKLVDPSGDFESQVESLASDFLDNVVPKISAHVKGESKESSPPPKMTRAAPAKKAATKAVQVEEPEFPEEDEQLPF